MNADARCAGDLGEFADFGSGDERPSYGKSANSCSNHYNAHVIIFSLVVIVFSRVSGVRNIQDQLGK